MFTQTTDQELVEATTARFLAAQYPATGVRAMAEQDALFDAALWKQGAEFGWTAMLVPESAGGGSVSGNGVADLLPVAFQFGRHAAPGPLIGTNVVAAALGRWGTPEQHSGVLAELLAGSTTAVWAPPAGTHRPAAPGVRAVGSGDGVVLTGRVPYVECGAENAVLLVPAEQDGVRSHYLLPLDTPGVEVVPLGGVDLTRRYQAVVLRDVVVPQASRVGGPGAADAQDAVLLQLTAVVQAAEIVGAMQRAFDLTLQWTQDRYSFGRPLGSYQEIKHRVADLRTHLEAAAAITAKAARLLGDDVPEAPTFAAAAKAFAGRVGPEVIQDCIQIHGGIGVTFEHDLHLYLRRATANAQLFGTPMYFHGRLVDLIAADTPEPPTGNGK